METDRLSWSIQLHSRSEKITCSICRKRNDRHWRDSIYWKNGRVQLSTILWKSKHQHLCARRLWKWDLNVIKRYERDLFPVNRRFSVIFTKKSIDHSRWKTFSFKLWIPVLLDGIQLHTDYLQCILFKWIRGEKLEQESIKQNELQFNANNWGTLGQIRVNQTKSYEHQCWWQKFIWL